MKTRKELLKSPGYWLARFQTELFRCVRNYLKSEKKTQTQFAEQLGVSKGYVSQVLNGDFDHKISSFIKLSLSAGYIPEIKLTPIEEYISRDEKLAEYNYKPVKITLVSMSNNIKKAA
ncbi:MAG: helix-turn-helix transcriptional regulator [Bacteroidales bacterium]|nr:helix-turn-helix transcriptional regulator [Bacteroidales bacterium]MBR4094710.1 helix-turn-helix transcriptional regulator [Bacteroidales bacterium]